MGEWIGKIIACLASIFFIAIIGFVAVIFSVLSGGQTFYTPLIIAVIAALILYVVMLFFAISKIRIVNRSLLGFFVACVLSIAVYEGIQAYHNSIPTVSEQDFDLSAYRPFQENTKAVALDQPSALKLESPLPRLDGATALYPLYSAFAQAVYPMKEYDLYSSEVSVNTTPKAYTNLIDGTADLIFVAGPSIQQLAIAKENGVELKLTPIGREAFVFFVHADNPVKGLTTEQIQGIYSGAITNWQEVGGKNESIRAFQRPEDSGSQTMLQKVMGNRKLMKPPNEDRISGMGGIIEKTSDYKNYPNAIGYSFRFFATEMVSNGNIRLLEVDGVMPSKETIANQTYPLAAEFYAVTADSENPNVSKLIEWILSPQGQSLVEKTGYTPLAGS